MSYLFLKGCTELLSCRKLSKNFHDYLSSLFTRTVYRISRKYYKLKNTSDLVGDFLQDFYEKLYKLCELVLKNTNQIKSIDAYVNQSIANFLKMKFESFVKEKEKILSLDEKVDKSGKGDDEFIEIIGYEYEEDTFSKVIAEDVFEFFLKECEKKKTDMKRYICSFISQEISNEDRFSNPNWSDANKYKIRERTKKFIRDFAEKFSVEEKVMGLVLKKFMSEICKKMNLNS
ncbi:hypothetical protein [Thermotoga profunda]|uniref:hypothetical protein n=1 Tax=Thermotoga profunda TaxID=1508420 RepID=UPI000596E590|nr:hypothetical protein [Thermotoga profunda]